MTKRSLKRWFAGVGALYAIAVIVGMMLRGLPEAWPYEMFKDMILLIIAIPAVVLGYCLQRRLSYLQQLRLLWSTLVDAIQECMIYTRRAKPSEDQYLNVLRKLSVAIDEIRGVFDNLKGASGVRSLYPFEPIKDIYQLAEGLGYEPGTESKRAEVRKKVFNLWRETRDELLREFDRELPTFSHSHWEDPSKAKVYEQHGIEKTPS